MHGVSKLSVVESGDVDHNDFLLVTHLVPLRNQSVIIHWKANSIASVREFQVQRLLKVFKSHS